MKYLVREMREVVVIEGLPCIKKWNETFQVLEEGLTYTVGLKWGFEPDTLVINSLGEIILLRDEDRYRTILNREDIKSTLSTIRPESFDYYNMILNKMISYERDAIIDNLLKKEEEEEEWI